MIEPVWRFERERMTDAPLDVVCAALGGAFREEIRHGLGAEERILVQAEATKEGTRLKLEATLRGWGGFVRIPFFERRVDQFLKRFVESL